jgi:hypothetical protein
MRSRNLKRRIRVRATLALKIDSLIQSRNRMETEKAHAWPAPTKRMQRSERIPTPLPRTQALPVTTYAMACHAGKRHLACLAHAAAGRLSSFAPRQTSCWRNNKHSLRSLKLNTERELQVEIGCGSGSRTHLSKFMRLRSVLWSSFPR